MRRTLPLGFLRGLSGLFRGDLGGPGRAAAILYGLAVTTAGYLAAGRQARRIGRKRERLERNGHGRLRVLMVTPRNPLLQGGVERHVMEVSKCLAAEPGVEVEVLCTQPGGPALAEQEHEGVRIRTVRAWPANRDWCFAPRLWREMARQPWDLIHVQSYHTLVAPLAMARALSLGVPYVVTFHGGGHSLELRNRARPLQRRLLGPLLRRAARLVAVAAFEIEEYGAELDVSAERFALIPNGTDLAFSTTVGNGSSPRGTEDGAPVLATLGRLERYKGHHRVIAAFPEVLADHPSARLIVVGTGPFEEQLREQVAALGIGDSVEFTSTPPDQPQAMAELLSGVSLVVLMSEFETHPLVALEAAAAGCRLLVADAGGLGKLAADGFARAVPLEERAAHVGQAMLEELAKPAPSERPQLISWEQCASSLLALYRSLA